MKPRDIFWTILTDNFPLLDECQTLSANVLALLPYERAHDDSNVSIIMIPNTTTWVLSHLTLTAALNSTDSNEVLTSKSHRIYRLWGIVGIVLMSPFSRQGQNLCGLSLAFILDWRVVSHKLLICTYVSVQDCLITRYFQHQQLL